MATNCEVSITSQPLRNLAGVELHGWGRVTNEKSPEYNRVGRVERFGVGGVIWLRLKLDWCPIFEAWEVAPADAPDALPSEETEATIA